MTVNFSKIFVLFFVTNILEEKIVMDDEHYFEFGGEVLNPTCSRTHEIVGCLCNRCTLKNKPPASTEDESDDDDETSYYKILEQKHLHIWRKDGTCGAGNTGLACTHTRPLSHTNTTYKLPSDKNPARIPSALSKILAEYELELEAEKKNLKDQLPKIIRKDVKTEKMD